MQNKSNFLFKIKFCTEVLVASLLFNLEFSIIYNFIPFPMNCIILIMEFSKVSLNILDFEEILIDEISEKQNFNRIQSKFNYIFCTFVKV